jgi:hypothetical protein
VSKGEFSERARAAIYEIDGGRCVGCGRTDLNAQHRRGRGMGGTRNPVIAQVTNGIPLCGSGTTGCHSWAEHHPKWARLLGWRLDGESAEEPFWTRFGWKRWVIEEDDGCPLVAYVDETDLDRLAEREEAVAAFRKWDAARPSLLPRR